MKKITQERSKQKEKRPKTDLDEKFIAIANQVMQAHGIKSDRAISIELGYRPDFINRVRNGVQSAPAAAWDALTNKYPEARSITNNVTVNGGGQAVGTVHGDNVYAPTSLEACQLELEQHKRDLASSRAEVENLRVQLTAKDEVIAAKNALIEAQNVNLSLLREVNK